MQWVTFLPESSRFPVLTSMFCLCGVSYVLPVFVWASFGVFWLQLTPQKHDSRCSRYSNLPLGVSVYVYVKDCMCTWHPTAITCPIWDASYLISSVSTITCGSTLALTRKKRLVKMNE